MIFGDSVVVCEHGLLVVIHVTSHENSKLPVENDLNDWKHAEEPKPCWKFIMKNVASGVSSVLK